MNFNVPKLVRAGAWIEIKDVNKGAANWRGMRDTRGVVGIVAHHSVTRPKGNWEKEVAEIDYIHRRINKWGGIGYNIIITTDNSNGYAKAVLVGDIASIRAHTTNSKGFKGWKAGAGNWYLVGICMVGELHKYNPTKEQLRTFKAIAEELIHNEDERFPGLKDWNCLYSHKQMNATACSGNWKWQKSAILSADIGELPTPKPTNTEVLVVEIKPGDGYAAIAERAGWKFWDDTNKVIATLKGYNPNHPSFARGNMVWATDPAFVVAYKEAEKPPAVHEPVEIEVPTVEVSKPETQIIETKVPPTVITPGARPYNKFLERKFLFAIILPVARIVTKTLGLDAYLDEYVEFGIDLVTFGAPMLWMWIEGQLDRRRIEQQTVIAVEQIKLETAKQLN